MDDAVSGRMKWILLVVSVVSVLLLLPLLLWSPLVSDNGYFIETVDYNSAYEPELKTLQFENGTAVFRSYYANGEVSEYEIIFDRVGDVWMLEDDPEQSEDKTDVSVSGDILTMKTIFGEGITPMVLEYRKVINPFTVWYIKYLEITRE